MQRGCFFIYTSLISEEQKKRGRAISCSTSKIRFISCSFLQSKLVELEVAHLCLVALGIHLNIIIRSGLTDFGKRAERHDIEKRAEAAGEMKGKLSQDLVVNYKNDFALGTWAPLSLASESAKTYHLDVFVDKCSIELFVNGGRIAMTNLVFPTTPYNNIKVYAEVGESAF